MKSLSKQVLFQVDEEDWEEVKKCTLKSKPHFHKRTICSNKINSIMLLYFRNALETFFQKARYWKVWCESHYFKCIYSRSKSLLSRKLIASNVGIKFQQIHILKYFCLNIYTHVSNCKLIQFSAKGYLLLSNLPPFSQPIILLKLHLFHIICEDMFPIPSEGTFVRNMVILESLLCWI